MQGLAKSLGIYWTAYGGVKALLSSPYLWISLGAAFFVALCKPCKIELWTDLTIQIFPSLLGFTLGGYALLIGVGNDRFREIIRGKDEDGTPSPYMRVNAAFVHFLLFQVLAICTALFNLFLSIDHILFHFLAIWIMFYALLCTIAAILALLNLASWYDAMPKE